ncbi:hypothetical protein GEMRC1_011784 [Eukaryota sp. GEM-RC1]
MEIEDPWYCLCCGHAGCAECYSVYLKSQIEGSNSVEIKCILMADCPVIADPEFVVSKVSDDVRAKYEKYLVDHFVTSSRRYVYCPHPGCCRIVSKPDPTPDFLECACGKTFCPKCAFQEDHRPASCDDVKVWEDKGALDKLSSIWLKENTKECPSCAKKIEKNGGCLHMTCSSCRYEFCWSCMADWRSHGDYYGCSRTSDNKTKRGGGDKEIRQLRRWNLCHDRFVNHSQGYDLEVGLRERLEGLINQHFDSNPTAVVSVDFVFDALDVLILGRVHLKWSYCFIYGVDSDDFREMFEFRQGEVGVHCRSNY